MNKTIQMKAFLKNNELIQINGNNYKLDNPLISLEPDSIQDIAILVQINNFVVLQKEEILDDIVLILSKIDKYQKGKMSSKEVIKMTNKLKNYEQLDSIVLKMEKEEQLDAIDLFVLNNICKNFTFILSFNSKDLLIKEIVLNNEVNIELSADCDTLKEELIKEINKESLNPNEQNELSFLFEEQETERLNLMRDKILGIMGKDSGLKAKKELVNSVDEYLILKNEKLINNSLVNLSVDAEFPIPQANNLERIINLGNEIFRSGDSKINLTVLENDIDKRDVHYYTRALCYLKLAVIDNRSRDLCLTYEGEIFYKSSIDEKKDMIFSILNTDPIVKKIIENNLDLNNSDHVKEFELRGINSDSTIARRISSIKNWINYLSN